ncbi:MAG: cysteine peptidase family C39 domain-containing protein, partial [Rubripirellula sp.]
FSGRLHWTNSLPLASAVFWSSLMPIILCFTAGLARKTEGLTRRVRMATMFGLGGLAVAYTFTPIVRPVVAPIDLSDSSQWSDGVCLQSHSSSCAPAAAVTLLRVSGVVASERDLALACLTSQHGTEPVGLFRGLNAFVAGPHLSARVASVDPDRWTKQRQLPNISLIRFRSSDTSLSRLMGARGEGHAVVVFGRDSEGDWIIGDPAFGRTKWSDEQFQSRFTGDAIFLAQTKTRFE